MRADDKAIASRLRRARIDIFGEEGVPALAEALGLPAGTWSNYEAGVGIPGVVLLRFMELTSASTGWLLTGDGARPHRPDPRGGPLSGPPAMTLPDAARLDWLQTLDLEQFVVLAGFVKKSGRDIRGAIDSLKAEYERAEAEAEPLGE